MNYVVLLLPGDRWYAGELFDAGFRTEYDTPLGLSLWSPPWLQPIPAHTIEITFFLGKIKRLPAAQVAPFFDNPWRVWADMELGGGGILQPQSLVPGEKIMLSLFPRGSYSPLLMNEPEMIMKVVTASLPGGDVMVRLEIAGEGCQMQSGEDYAGVSYAPP